MSLWEGGRERKDIKNQETELEREEKQTQALTKIFRASISPATCHVLLLHHS